VEASELLLPIVTAALAAAAATPFVGSLARRLGAVDRPNERKVNVRLDMPLIGGLAVAIGCAVGIAVGVSTADFVYSGDRLLGYAVGSVLLLATGIVDDRFGMRAGPKLLMQVAVAVIAVYAGFRIDYLSEPFTEHTFALPPAVALLITTTWIVLVTNATNLIDGLDGLAAGLGAIIATTLTLICWEMGQIAGVVMGIALVGALLGFLPFNFYPARIFLGDTGALFIGYSLSLIALEGHRKTALLTFIVPLLALAVPILDVVVSVIRRWRAGKPIFSADRFHMHHRLLRAEGSQRAAVLALYLLTTCFCMIAVSFTRLRGTWAVVLLLAVTVLTIRLLRNLGVLTPPPDEPDLVGTGEGESK